MSQRYIPVFFRGDERILLLGFFQPLDIASPSRASSMVVLIHTGTTLPRNMTHPKNGMKTRKHQSVTPRPISLR